VRSFLAFQPIDAFVATGDSHFEASPNAAPKILLTPTNADTPFDAAQGGSGLYSCVLRGSITNSGWTRA
jgi:hypothetical protein